MGQRTLYSGNHWILGFDLCLGFEQGLEVFGTGDALGRTVLDGGLVGFGVWVEGEGGFVVMGEGEGERAE